MDNKNPDQNSTSQGQSSSGENEKSFFGVIVHSFFIIPFLIAVFCVLLFTAMHLLTTERRSVYDYLEDVKTGGMTKRWQGAFELSKILANPEQIPKEERFSRELIAAFEHSIHDDSRVRQYLALAMGRTQNPEFIQPLLAGLKEETSEENVPAILYALGMLRGNKAAPVLMEYAQHSAPRIRSIAIAALGNLEMVQELKPVFKKALDDSEANVQWGAAVSLASMGDFSGKEIILKLLDRDYLDQYAEVDPDEQTNLILTALRASFPFKDQDLKENIKKLAENDKNMLVRAKALEYLNKKP